MDITLAQNYPIISSQVSTKFLIAQFFEALEYENDQYWLNIHDKRVEALIGLPRLGRLQYDTSMPVTTNCFDFYGTTSLWWLVVLCSEYTHPHEIPTGTTINLPTLTTIQSNFEKALTGLRNKVVEI